MANPTFIQDSRVGRTIFQIRDETLCISASTSEGLKEYEIELRRLDPDYQTGAVRLYRVLLALGTLLVLVAGVFWGMKHQRVIPQEALGVAYMGVLLFAGSVFIHAVRWSSRVAFYHFNDQWGKPALGLVRERAQAAECDAFVLELVAHIRMAQAADDGAERQRLLTDLAAQKAFLAPPRAEVQKWQLALASGLLASGLPWLLRSIEGTELWGFMLVFSLCVAGPAFCYLSFQAREPKRWWSLTGAAFAFVPVFFYN